MIDSGTPLLLGSSSPRRRELLTKLGLPLRFAAADVDETGRSGEPAAEYLVRVTGLKLEATASLPEAAGAGGILVADTSVILDGAVLGKPRDEADARGMIRALSGREHEVWTRFAIAGPGEPHPGHLSHHAHPSHPSHHADPSHRADPSHHAGPSFQTLHAETVSTRVRFRALDEEEIAAYAATGEGLDKAGAYAVQGIGAFAVARIDGSWSNVVGLPVCEVIAALRGVGLLGLFPMPAARS